MKNIAKTGFFTSIASYFIFAFFDYLRPGFVSHNFSAHWFLLIAILFAIIWVGHGIDKSGDRLGAVVKFILSFGFQLITAIILFVIIWRESEIFGDFRILLALIGFLMPWISMRLLRN